MSNKCERCIEWSNMGLSDTCPSCDLAKEKKPREFWICKNPMDDKCTDAHVYDTKPIWFDEKTGFHVIEYSAFKSKSNESDRHYRWFQEENTLRLYIYDIYTLFKKTLEQISQVRTDQPRQVLISMAIKGLNAEKQIKDRG